MKLKRLLEPLFITIIISIATIVNFWHVIWGYLHRPPGTIFIGISHYYQDYFYYLSQVTQGIQGNLMVRNLYTTEKIPATPLWLVNIAIGKLAAIFNLRPWTAYDATIVAASIFSLYLLYYAAKKIFPDNLTARISAFAVAVFSTCFYKTITDPTGNTTIKPIDYFYSYTLSLNRLGGVAHLLIQNILSLGVILSYGLILKLIFAPAITPAKITQKILIFAITISVLMLINPLYVAVDTVAIIITTILYFLRYPKWKRFGFILITAVLTGAILIIPTIIISQSFNIPFYQYFRWWESTVRTINAQTFFMSMGIVLPFSIIGIIPFLKKASPIRILGFIWILIPISLYFSDIPHRLMLPYFRLTQPPAYIFIAALCIEGMMLIANIFRFIPISKIQTLIFSGILVTFLSFQIPMIQKEVMLRRSAVMMDSWLNYADPKLIEGLDYLSRQPHLKNVLAFNLLESLIPAVTGQTVYAGHESLTVNYGGKIVEATHFFTCAMSPPEAKSFLINNNIGFVAWKNIDGDPIRYTNCYPFLNKLYTNPSLTIFTIGS
jgi:hypothetical protein